MRSLPYQQELLYFCGIMDDNLNAVKPFVYHEELADFDSVVQQFKNNQINFIAYCQKLKEVAEANLVEFDDMDDLEKLFTVIDLETKINFPRVDVERYVAVRRITNQLDEAASTELLAKEFSFRTKKISSEDYHFYLKELFEQQSFSIDEFPHLKNYIEYLSAFSHINQNKALEQSSGLEKAIYSALIRDDNQRKLYEIAHYMHLVGKFSNLQMTRNYVKEYHEYRDKMSFENMFSFLNSVAKENNLTLALDANVNVIETNLENFKEFYRLAYMREQSLVQNTLDLMNENERKIIVLIAGGFHTRGITEQLKEADVSYVVVTPNMENDQKPIPYISLLQNLRTPLEQMLATHSSTLKVASWLSQNLPPAFEGKKDMLATKMKTLLTTTKLYDLYMNVLVQYSPEERMLIQNRLQDQLRDQINEIVRKTGYDNVLEVSDVEITVDDIIAQIQFKGSTTPIYVHYTDRLETQQLDPEVEQAMLEMVSLEDGVTTEFMSSMGYLQVTGSYRTLRTKILEMIFDNALSMSDIIEKLKEENPGLAVSDTEVSTLLESFMNMGLVEQKQEQFFVSRKEPTRFNAYLTMALFQAHESAGELAGSELGILKHEDVPEKYQEIFNRLNVGTLMVEPMLPMDTLNKLVENLLAFEAEDKLQSGATLDIGDNSQIYVIQPARSENLGKDKLIVYVRTKMEQPVEVTSLRDRVDDSVRQQFDLPSIAAPTSYTGENRLEKRFIDALEKISNKSQVDFTSNAYSQGEKAAVLEYLYKYMGVIPDQGSKLELAMNLYIGLRESTAPYYSKRVAQKLVGSSFDAQFNNALLLLTRLNPEVQVTPELEVQLSHSIVALNLAHNNGIIGDTVWFDLLDSVMDTAPAAHRKTSIYNAASSLIDQMRTHFDASKIFAEISALPADQQQDALANKQKELGIELGSYPDMDSIQQMINSQIIALETPALDQQQPVLANATRRKNLLDKAVAENQIIKFQSRDASQSVEVKMMQKSADGSYVGVVEATGDVFQIDLLSYSKNNAEFKYRDQKNEGEFNDSAGYFVSRLDSENMPLDSVAAQLRAYSGLQRKWQQMAEGRAIESVEERLAGFIDVSKQQQLSMIDMLRRGNDQILENDRKRSTRLANLQKIVSDIDSRQEEFQKLRDEVVALDRQRPQVSTQLESLDQQLKKTESQLKWEKNAQLNLLRIMIGKLVMAQLAKRLVEIHKNAIRDGKDPVEAINREGSSWFNLKSGESLSVVLSNKELIKNRLDPLKLLRSDDMKAIQAMASKWASLQDINTIFETGLRNRTSPMNMSLVNDLSQHLPTVFNMSRNILHLKTLKTQEGQEARDARVNRLVSNVNQLIGLKINMPVLKEKNELISSVSLKIDQLKTRQQELRELATTGYFEKSKRLLDEISALKTKMANDQDNRPVALEQIDSLQASLEYNKLLKSNIDILIAKIEAGETTITINHREVPIVRENLLTIVYGLTASVAGVKAIELEYKPLGTEQARRDLAIANAVSDIAYDNFFKNSPIAVDVTRQPFEEFQTGDASEFLLYGNDDAGVFNTFKNKTDNYALQTLLQQAFDLVGLVDPATASWIQSDARVVVSKKPLLPTQGRALENLAQLSSSTNTVFIEKAVFGKILEVMPTSPQLAVKLMAAALVSSGQLAVARHEGILNLNTASASDIAQLMTDRLKQTNPDLFEVAETRNNAEQLLNRSADAIINLRTQGPVTSLDQLNGTIGQPIIDLIQPYVKFEQMPVTEAYKAGLDKANDVLGSSYQDVRRMLTIERGVNLLGVVNDGTPSYLAVDDVETWVTPFQNTTLPVSDQYKIFFERLVGSDAIFDQIAATVSDFNMASNSAVFFDNANRLNELIGYLTNIDNYTVNAYRKDRVQQFDVTFPNGYKTTMTQDEYTNFQNRLKTIQGSINAYYNPAEGIGFEVRFPGKATKQLPVFITTQNPSVVTNDLLDQARQRPGQLDFNHPMQQPLISVIDAVRGVELLNPIARADVAETLQQREVALQIRDTFNRIAERIPDAWDRLNHSEKKGLAGLLLTNNQLGLEWVDTVSGLYNESVPLIVSDRVKSIYKNLFVEAKKSNFITAKHELADLVAHQDWKLLDPAVRRTVVDQIIANNNLSPETTVRLRGNILLDEISALLKFFAAIDKEAASVQPGRLTGSAISLMWENEKQALDKANDALYINSVFSNYREMIYQARQALLEEAREAGEWQSSARNESRQLSFLDGTMKMGQMVNAYQVVEDFNATYAGVMKIQADREYIGEHVDQVLALVGQLTADLTIDESVGEEDRLRIGMVSDYQKAKELWFDGSQTESLALMEQLRDSIQSSNLFGTREARYDIDYDVKQLQQIMAEPEKAQDYTSQDLFSGFEMLFRESLNRANDDVFLPLLMSVPDFVGHGARPLEGVTDVVINLKNVVADAELPERIEQQQFREDGISLHNRNVFVDIERFNPVESTDKLSDSVRDAVSNRFNFVDATIKQLENMNLPVDLRLGLFATKTLQTLDSGTMLDNGFMMNGVTFTEGDFGKELPVAMHPLKYKEMLEKEMRGFDTMRGLISEASRLIRENAEYESARILLVQAQFIIVNMEHFTEQFRNIVMQSIAKDIEEIDSMIAAEAEGTVAPAIYLYGQKNSQFIERDDIANDATISQVFKLAFEELDKINPELKRDIADNMSVVLGSRPREQIPLDTIYISPAKMEILKQLASNANTLPIAGIMLAKTLSATGATGAVHQFSSKVLSDYLSNNKDLMERYIAHTQLPVGAVAADFTGEIITPLEKKFDKKGQFFADIKGPRTVTKFKNGRAVSVWDSVTGKEFTIPAVVENTQLDGYRISLNESREPAVIETLSPVEEWLGFLEYNEEVYFLSKGNQVVALVKAGPQQENIVPLRTNEEMQEILGVSGMDAVMEELRAIVDARRTELRQDALYDRLFPEGDMPELDIQNPRKYDWKKSIATKALVMVPLALLLMTGCATTSPQSRIEPSQLMNPYDNSQLFAPDSNQTFTTDGVAPHDLQPFIGTSGSDNVDRAAVEQVHNDTQSILQKSLDTAKTELKLLLDAGTLDPARVRRLQERVQSIENTIDNFASVYLGTPKLNKQIIAEEVPITRVDTQQVDTPVDDQVQYVPDAVQQQFDNITGNRSFINMYQQTRQFSRAIAINNGDFRGMITSYAGQTDDPDGARLIKYGRTMPYDVAVSIMADLSNNNPILAKNKVKALLRLMQKERSPKFKGVMHFGYNTKDDSYISSLAPLGNTAWALKAIYGYIDATGDNTVLQGVNAELLDDAMKFVLSQQVVDQNDARYGLFRAGVQSKDRTGYAVLGSEHQQKEHVVFEHQTDVHDLLNFAYRVTANTEFKTARELLDKSVMERMYRDLGDQGAYFLLAIDGNGQPDLSGIGIDDLTWAGSMVLTMDHLSLDQRMRIVGKLMQYLDEHFMVAHQIGSQSARQVTLNDQLMRQSIPESTIVGVKFYDKMGEGLDWNDPKVMSVQAEAQLGYIHLLNQVAALTTDRNVQDYILDKANFLLDNVRKLHRQQSKIGGIPYSTRNLKGVQSDMESAVATETFRALYGMMKNPQNLWSFIGVPEKNDNVQTTKTRVVGNTAGGFVPQMPLSNVARPGTLNVSARQVYAFDAEKGFIVHPEVRYGAQPQEYPEDPTLTLQMQKDIKNLLTRVEQEIMKNNNFNPEAVADWQGDFVDAPVWNADASNIPALNVLQKNRPYNATIENGSLVLSSDIPVALQRLGIKTDKPGMEYLIEVRQNDIRLVQTLSQKEIERYGEYSYDTQRLFYDANAQITTLPLSDFPELQSIKAGTVLRSEVDLNMQTLNLISPAKTIKVASTLVSNGGINAPDGTKYTLTVNDAGQVSVAEQVNMASVFNNPWTPHLPPQMLPQFFAGLKASGHTSLVVNPHPLVLGRKIQDMDPRVYYMSLLNYARQYGIEVHASIGSPRWVLPGGPSEAMMYLATLGRAGVDFDGFVIDMNIELLPEYQQASPAQKQLMMQRYIEALRVLETNLDYYAGGDRPIMVNLRQDIKSAPGYMPVDRTNDLLVIDHTDVDQILKTVRDMNPSRPFSIQLKTSLDTDATRTFATHEADLPAVIKSVTEQLRQDSQIGQYFQGFVINHDQGEDIYSVLKFGKGRDLAQRLRDYAYGMGDDLLQYTNGAYELIISGGEVSVVHIGEEQPTSAEVAFNTTTSRLEAMARGITGAANVDNMVRSIIETIKRDKFTVLPETLPLGAEFGLGIAGGNMMWGQQYSDLAQLGTVSIQGLDEKGQIVATWDDIVNTTSPIQVGKDSVIKELKVICQVQAKEFKATSFPGYVVFLTHHPENGGYVTEYASDEIELGSGESTTVSFTVPVSGEGMRDYGFMLMHGRKLSKQEAVTDRIGFGHRYGLISDWMNRHAEQFDDFYADFVKGNPELRNNSLGMWSGQVHNRLMIEHFSVDQLDITKDSTQHLIQSLVQSGVNEVSLDAKRLLEMYDSARDIEIAKKVLIDFISELHKRSIDVTIMIGDEAWLTDQKSMENDLFVLLRLKLPVNGFVVNLGDKTSQIDINKISQYTSDSGYGAAQPVDITQLTNVSDARELGNRISKVSKDKGAILQVPISNLSDVTTILDGLPVPDAKDLVARAKGITEADLERFVSSGYYSLTNIEKALMEFSRIKRMPPIRLGQAAAQVDLLSPKNVFVEKGETPYIALKLSDIGDRELSTLIAIVELTNVQTGEHISQAIPLVYKKGFNEQVIVPIEKLRTGQWRYDVSVVPESYARDRAFVPAMPLTQLGATVMVGSREVTVQPSKRVVVNEVLTSRRNVTFAGHELTLVDVDGAPSYVEFEGQAYELLNETEGVNLELGLTKILVNISKSRFGEWAIGTGGEEVTITRYKNLEEVLTVGVAHRSKVFGHIQHGLPDIAITNVDISLDNSFIPDQASEVIYFNYGKSFKVDGATVTLGHPRAGMIQATVVMPDGKIFRKAFPALSSQRTLTVGDYLLMIGTDSEGKPIAVKSQFITGEIQFTVENKPTATSPLSYLPEVAFYHPMVGEISITNGEEYTIDVGETRVISMQVPIPSDFLAQQKLQLMKILNEMNNISISYKSFMRDRQIDEAKGLRTATAINQDIQTRYRQIKQQLPQFIVDAKRLIQEVQSLKMSAELQLKGIIDLDERAHNLTELAYRIDNAKLTDIPYIMIDLNHEMAQLKGDLSSFSSQKMGYNVSIHDVSNLLGEQVFANGQTAVSAEDEEPVVREVLIDRVNDKSELQAVRRIGKSEYAEVVTGIMTPAIIQETHNAYMYQLHDVFNAKLQYQDLMRDIFRAQSYNIPSSKMAVGSAQESIQLAATDKQRALTVDLTTVFYEALNLVKVADMSQGRGYVLDYAETVVEGEKLIYDMSNEAVALLLGALQSDDSLAVKSDASRFFKDLSQLFGLIERDGVTTDEAVIIVKGFLRGADQAEIDRAVEVVQTIMKDTHKTNRVKAAIIVMEIATAKEMRAYIKHVSFDRLWRQLDKEESEARVDLAGQPDKLNDELSRIRSIRAYMKLVIEHDKAKLLVDEANTVYEQGGDPVMQVAQARSHFQNALGYFQIIAGIETEFAPVTDLHGLLDKIDRSDQPQLQKDNLKATVQRVIDRLKKFDSFMQEREKAITGAQDTLVSRKNDVQRAENLYEHLQTIKSSHQLFVEQLEAQSDETFKLWQHAIKNTPPQAAIKSIEQVITLEIGNFTSFVEGYQQAKVDQENTRALHAYYTSELSKMREQLAGSTSDVRKAMYRNQIQSYSSEMFRLTADMQYFDWLVPYLEKQIDRTYGHVVEMQGAIMALGGKTDLNILQRQIAQVTKKFKTAQAVESTIDRNVDKLAQQESALAKRLEQLQERYDFQGRLQAVGQSIEYQHHFTGLCIYK